MLLLHKGGLVKSVNFKNYRYVGDPINAVKIFNEKEVDEIAVIDIDATRDGKSPNIKMIAEIAGEAFMPMSYGGGISTVDQVKEIFYNGIEKVVINKSATTNPQLITDAAKLFGNQSVVVSIDVKKGFWGKESIYTDNGSNNTRLIPEQFVKEMENAGAGEILINSIERDGTYKGYDLPLIQKLAQAVNIPIIAAGGAGSIDDFLKAIQHGASAVAAGSFFVFKRPHNAVLISYPAPQKIVNELYQKL